MKKNILVLALSIVGFGAFAQGLGDLKKAAKDAEQVQEKANVAVKKGKEAVVASEDKAKAASSEKENDLKKKVADATNIDVETVDAASDAVAGVAKDATAEKVDAIKATATAKLDDAKAKRTEKLEAIKGDSEKVAEHNANLKAEATEKEAEKDEKKAALLTKITALGSKITAAESKLTSLKEAGASEEEVSTKTKVIDAAKEKLAALTSSYL